jgi:preprotein translocase subunit YajC
MSFSLISTALAATPAAGNPSTETFQFILFIVAFVLFFYFILWRPQNKRAKEQQSMLSNLAKGDEIVTNGGILGKINNISGDFVVLTIAEGIDVIVQKASIASTVPKGTMKSI